MNGFEEQEAKGFMDMQLKARGLESTAMDDKTWAAVFKASVMHDMLEASTQQEGFSSCLLV